MKGAMSIVPGSRIAPSTPSVAVIGDTLPNAVALIAGSVKSPLIETSMLGTWGTAPVKLRSGLKFDSSSSTPLTDSRVAFA